MPNVELPSNFADRLRGRRLARHLTEAELADRAGLTYKTVHALENGRRSRALEKTVLSLAVALECPVEDLLGAGHETPTVASPTTASTDGARNGRLSRRRLVAAAGLVGSVVVACVFLVGLARARAELAVERDRIVAHDPIFGLRMWERSFAEGLTFVDASPWDRAHVLVGTGSATSEGGRLHLVERSSGRSVWSRGVDLEAVAEAFGSEIVHAAPFSVQQAEARDFRGDGTVELAVRFTHALYYPTVIARIDREGALRGHYAHRGHLTRMFLHDLDDDGIPELVAAGTNNHRELGGATVLLLDSDHWRGASREPFADEGSRARIVLPNFPDLHMRQMQRQRLQVERIGVFRTPAGETRLNVEVGIEEAKQVVVVLGSTLEPIEVRAKDALVAWIDSAWPDELRRENGPADQGWLDTWLAGARRHVGSKSAGRIGSGPSRS